MESESTIRYDKIYNNKTNESPHSPPLARTLILKETIIAPLSASQIRRAFLDFYQSKNHKLISSFKVVCDYDPTTLFVNSGMMPLKGVFLGQNPQGYKRVCNSQKVLRVSGKHNDLDEVGRDDYHHTFFEMLGHWSFGDYFKKETIQWGWELLTEVFGLPKQHLYVTVHHKDLESRTLWIHETDVDPSHVLSFDEPNFWTMGPTGPCGYCSEIHIDKQFGDLDDPSFMCPKRGVNSDEGRFIELINFVFMDSIRTSDGSITPLSQKHIDTGAGFERLCSVIQGQPSAYETDLFQPIINQIVARSKVAYQSGPQGMPHRVIADHLRAVSVALADGVSFDREGRGYIIRRILRRAQRFGHQLNMTSPFMSDLFESLVSTLGEPYPELVQHADLIKHALDAEETQFAKTLELGIVRLNHEIKELHKKGLTTLSGQVMFHLHDTYGFPVDLSEQIAAEHGLSYDQKAFDEAMKIQKSTAQKTHKFHDHQHQWQELTGHGTDSVFCGYEQLSSPVITTRFRRISSPKNEVFYEFVFDKTPFYPTSGGQVGDQGTLTNSHGTFKVMTTTKHMDRIIHRCQLVHSHQKADAVHDIALIKSFHAEVDIDHRNGCARHHSATHLLHRALKNVLGDHITQRGSYCDHEGLRFDFSHPKPITLSEQEDIESHVNDMIIQNHLVVVSREDFETAKSQGALYMTSESYDSQVRVLTMGSVSKELCGGTHVTSTALIGLFVILSESSIASGTRRISACAGPSARQWLKQRHSELALIENLMSPHGASVSCPDDLTYPTALKIHKLKENIDQLKKQAQKLEMIEIQELITHLLRLSTKHSSGISYLMADISDQLGDLSSGSISQHHLFLDMLAQQISKHHQIACCWILSPHKSSSTYDIKFYCAVSADLKSQWPAGKLVNRIAQIWQGKGGGRADRAQGGAKNIKLDHIDIRDQIIHFMEQLTPDEL